MNKALQMLSRTVFAATVGLLFFAQTASGQTVDLRFNTTINVGAGTGGVDQLEVVLEADTDIDFAIGNSNFRFFYNSAALDIPSGVSAGNQALTAVTDYDFQSPFINNPGGGQFYISSTVVTQGQLDRISANLVLDIANLGQTVSSGAGWVPIVTLYFDITDDQQTEGLTWVSSGDANPPQIFFQDNTTPVAIGVTFDSDLPLDAAAAVELATFSSRVDDDAVALTWSTASESNNAGFAIEIAPVGSQEWTEVGFVAGGGTSNAVRNYAYSITDVDYGTYRIRLKQLGLDGTFDYSAEIEVSVELDLAFELGDVYPSPFANSANFSLVVRDAQPVTVEAFNLLGQKVLTIFDGDMGPNESRSFVIDGSSLADGLYLVRAKGASFAATKSVAVVK